MVYLNEAESILFDVHHSECFWALPSGWELLKTVVAELGQEKDDCVKQLEEEVVWRVQPLLYFEKEGLGNCNTTGVIVFFVPPDLCPLGHIFLG